MKIRTQITAFTALIVALVVALAGFLFIMREDHRNRDELDETLASRAAAVKESATRSGVLPTDGSYVVRLVQDGELRGQVGTEAVFPLGVKEGFSTVWAGDSDWRSYSEPLTGGGQMQILISTAVLEERHTDNVLLVDLLVVLAALLSAVGVWFATGLVLRPYQRLSAAARELPPDGRLPEVGGPREVVEMTASLNAMLDKANKAGESDQERPAGGERTTTAERPISEERAAESVEKTQEIQKPVLPVPVAEPMPVPKKEVDLSVQLASLGANLDTLLDNPEMPATQRHLLLAVMADDHREMKARLEDR